MVTFGRQMDVHPFAYQKPLLLTAENVVVNKQLFSHLKHKMAFKYYTGQKCGRFRNNTGNSKDPFSNIGTS